MKINLKNKEKVMAVIREVEARAKTRCIGNYDYLLDIVEDATKRLRAGVGDTKAALNGVQVRWQANEHLPNAYFKKSFFPPAGTYVEFTYNRTGDVFITALGRTYIANRDDEYDVQLTDDYMERVERNMSRF